MRAGNSANSVKNVETWFQVRCPSGEAGCMNSFSRISDPAAEGGHSPTPVRRQSEDPRGQVGNPDARKNQEPVVLHKPIKVRHPRPRLPAGGPEAGPAQTAVPLGDEPLAQPRVGRRRRAQRMAQFQLRPRRSQQASGLPFKPRHPASARSAAPFFTGPQ